MRKKLTIEVIEKAAKQTGIDDAQRQRLLEMLADMTTDADDGEEKAPPIKKQFVVLLSDPTGELAKIEAVVCWVCQIEESEAPQTIIKRVHESAHHFNTTKKGRITPVQSVGEALEIVPARITKEQGLWVKTKSPVYALPIGSEIPDTPSILSDRDRGIDQ